MKAMSRLMLLVLSLGGGALAEETPSPALLVLNKGHRGSAPRVAETHRAAVPQPAGPPRS